MTDMRPAVFLDRDGVLNYNRPDHIKSPSEYAPIPAAAAAVAALNAAGWPVIVVSNQSGVGRGLFDQQALRAVTAKLVATLAAAGARADAVYYCPHAPEDGCDCRKPATGMLLRAAREQELDLGRSYMVGDSAADIACGRAVGARTVLVETGLADERPDPEVVRPHHLARDLAEAVAWILQDNRRESA